MMNSKKIIKDVENFIVYFKTEFLCVAVTVLKYTL